MVVNDGRSVRDGILSQLFDTPLIEGFPDMPANEIREDLDLGQGASQEQKKRSIVSAILGLFFSAQSTKSTESASARAMRTISFYKDLNIEVRSKSAAGFNISLIDYWGRAVSKKLFPRSNRAMGLTLLLVMQQKSFRNFSQLFPIFGSVERRPGDLENSTESHLFEFNPAEFGLWDATLNNFVDVSVLGTSLENGVPQERDSRKSTFHRENEPHFNLLVFNDSASLCINGYDNLGLVAGTSSSLFNTFFQYVYKLLCQLEQELSTIIFQLLKMFGISKSATIVHPEFALFSPNPFFGTARTSPGRSVAQAKSLYLANGGDDGQNIPLSYLLVPGRRVEVILAYDASSDAANFPNGTSLRQTAQRYHLNRSTVGTPVFKLDGIYRSVFPQVPSEYQVQHHPLFLGCDLHRDYPVIDSSLVTVNNGTGDKETRTRFVQQHPPPLIVYYANTAHTFASNTSTFRTTYSEAEVQNMLTNGYNVATYKNNTEFPDCLACAILKRRMTSEPPFCQACFDKYCFR